MIDNKSRGGKNTSCGLQRLNGALSLFCVNKEHTWARLTGSIQLKPG